MKKQTKDTDVDILKVSQKAITFSILGRTPLICNAMSQKVLQELLCPGPKKNRAAMASNLKHDPYREYRDSPYKSVGKNANTRILMPSTAFKAALGSVATDIPGAAKAQIGRLTYVEGDYVEIYGTPKLFMSVVRSADMNKTPDVRTRAIIPEWACKITVLYTVPLLKDKAIINLLAAAGVLRGIGDWRPEKGKGNYGQFEIVGKDDKNHKKILKQGIKAQDAALKDPECYDGETATLLNWFNDEAKERGFKVAA